MRKIVLASHGKLSEGMVDSVKMILGNRNDLSWLSLHPGEHPDDLCELLGKEVDENVKDDYIVVTDVLGGSVNNSLLKLLTRKNVHIITGMHLGLVLTLCSSNEEDIEKMIHQALKDTSGYIIYANDLLKEEW